MAKQKIIADPKKSKQKKALRIPTSKHSFTFKDKSKYSRKEKYKDSNED
jgi:hypothetical protein